MRDIFESIYINKVWKESFATESGPGSTLDCSEPYLMFLKKYSDKNNIQSIMYNSNTFNQMKNAEQKQAYDLKKSDKDSLDEIYETGCG